MKDKLALISLGLHFRVLELYFRLYHRIKYYKAWWSVLFFRKRAVFILKKYSADIQKKYSDVLFSSRSIAIPKIDWPEYHSFIRQEAAQQKRQKNWLYRHKVPKNLEFIKSMPVRRVNAQMISQVFKQQFHIALSETEALVLSTYPDAATISAQLLHFTELSNYKYFSKRQVECLGFFYKSFVEIIEIHNVFREHQAQTFKNTEESSRFFKDRLKHLQKGRFNLKYFKRKSGFGRERFPSIQSKLFQIHHLRYQIHQLKKDHRNLSKNIEREKQKRQEEMCLHFITETGIKKSHLKTSLLRRIGARSTSSSFLSDFEHISQQYFNRIKTLPETTFTN